MRNKRTASPLGKVFGYMALAIISIGVMVFLGSHSLNFFTYTFKADDAIFAWLGLLLTSVGAVFWLGIFLWNADTVLRQAISLIMMLVSLAGEMLTAVFDMQNAASYASGFQFLPTELKQMTEIIGYLGAFTGIMLILYTAGDAIIWAFQDDDGDKIPNVLDPVDNRTGQPTKGKGLFSWLKRDKSAPTPAPELVRQFNVDDIALIVRTELAKTAADVGQGTNGNGAVDPTKASPR